MMKELVVDLAERSYPILIGKGLLRQLPAQIMNRGITVKQKLFVITDDHIAPLYLDDVINSLNDAGFSVGHHIVPAGEKAKSLHYLEEITTTALQAGMDRKSVFIALGGGVVWDLAGFTAAAYMRGVPFIQVPTTLLAHDSSVGGKVAVNHPLGKNIIGAFHQPSLVLYDTDTLKTLPPREIYAGFAEVIKHGFIWSEDFTQWLDEHASPLLNLESPYIDEAIYQGCLIKSQVVAEDETELGKRAILNLGHTFGHAMEALTSYGQLIHGEAVAIGMVAAAVLAERLGIADAGEGLSARVAAVLKKFNLPVRIPAGLDPEQMVESMRHDKKGSEGKLVFVLPVRAGKVEVIKDVPGADVIEVIKMLKEVE